MGPPGRAWWVIAWFAITVMSVAACGGADGETVARWRLDGEVVAPGARGQEVVLPDHLDAVEPRAGTYTLSARVEVPARWRGAPLTVVVSDLPAIARLAVDGEPALATDPPAPGAYRQRGPLGWRVGGDATADGVLDLVFTVEHRWTQSAWWNGAPVLVAGDARTSAAASVIVNNLYLALAASIALLQLAITSLLIWLFDRTRRAYLWFAVQSLAAAFYPLHVLGFTQAVFGIHDTSVLAASLVIAILTALHFTHEFFELRPPSRVWLILSAVALGVVAVFTDPFHATPYAGPVVVALLVVLTGAQLVVCARIARTHPDRGTARIHLLAWIGLAVTMPPDLTYWLGLDDFLGGVRVGSIALLAMGVFLSMLLGGRHLRTLRLEAERSEQSRREVEALNVELRRQVTERSAQLFAALTIGGDHRVAAPALRAGEVINDRYKVVRELGRGGMGAVYEVERLGDGRRFALKLTHEVTGIALARLAREALIASRLAHKNLVGVVDVDVAASRFLFVVMELVDGTSLKALRDRHGDPAWALPLLAQVAEGLAALHHAGVVHRDLKPANVLLTEATGGLPIVKITDFGVSRRLGDEPVSWDLSSNDSDEAAARVLLAGDAGAAEATSQLAANAELEALAADGDAGVTAETAAVGPGRRRPPATAPPPSSGGGVTRTGLLVGTPAYIAPELIDGPQALTTAADMFAFGVLAWELLVGERPFVRPPAVARLRGEPPPPPPSLRTRWPRGSPEVVSLIERCLDLEPARRPSAEEVAAVLVAYVRRPRVRPAEPAIAKA